MHFGHSSNVQKSFFIILTLGMPHIVRTQRTVKSLSTTGSYYHHPCRQRHNRRHAHHNGGIDERIARSEILRHNIREHYSRHCPDSIVKRNVSERGGDNGICGFHKRCQEQPHEYAEYAHQDNADIRITAVIGAEIVPADDQRSVPQAPDNAAHGYRRRKRHFLLELRSEIRSPAEFLAKARNYSHNAHARAVKRRCRDIHMIALC